MEQEDVTTKAAIHQMTITDTVVPTKENRNQNNTTNTKNKVPNTRDRTMCLKKTGTYLEY